MGSAAPADIDITTNDIVKPEPLDAHTPTTEGSTSPEPDSITLPHDGSPTSQGPLPPPKRKGGRKPIYATSEERKQRNRQAQAAFRERRTEYIKQLEQTIQQHEEALATLQQSHRRAADECLMLRYKNALLERVLQDKGIDVDSELHMKGSPQLGPRRSGNINQPSPMQRAMLNRQQAAGRQRNMGPPPVQTVNQPLVSNSLGQIMNSPITQQTPSSQNSSPGLTRSPAFLSQHNASPIMDSQPRRPTTQYHSQRGAAVAQQHSFSGPQRSHSRSISATSQSQPSGHPYSRPVSMHSKTSQSRQNHYPSFQKHYDQLDQEYDAQVDMLDNLDAEDLEAENFISNFRLPAQSHNGVNSQVSPPATTSSRNETDSYDSLAIVPFEYDPMLDADPFGLTASMHFPQSFGLPPQARR